MILCYTHRFVLRPNAIMRVFNPENGNRRRDLQITTRLSSSNSADKREEGLQCWILVHSRKSSFFPVCYTQSFYPEFSENRLQLPNLYRCQPHFRIRPNHLCSIFFGMSDPEWSLSHQTIQFPVRLKVYHNGKSPTAFLLYYIMIAWESGNAFLCFPF